MQKYLGVSNKLPFTPFFEYFFRNWKIHICFFILFLIILPPGAYLHNCYPQSQIGDEYRVKSGFIYHFINFTEWWEASFPSKNSDIILCVASEDDNCNTSPGIHDKLIRVLEKHDITTSIETESPGEITKIIMELNNKSLKNRKIIVNICQKNDDLKNCHVLFIHSSAPEFVREKLEIVKNLNILTIGESPEFVKFGGIINFMTENKRLRFQVNVDAAKTAGLKLRSQLLMSAILIKKAGD